MKKKPPYILLVIILSLAGLGYTYTDKLFELSKQFSIFSSVYKELNTAYADEVDPTRLMRIAIDTMLKTLDPYTNYFSESRIEEAKFERSNQYSGIGCRLATLNGKVYIRSVAPGSSALERGLQAGDEILAIDNTQIKLGSQTLEEIEELLLGEDGSPLELLVTKWGQQVPTSLILTRKFLASEQKDVNYYGMAAENIGFIALSGFGENAFSEAAEACRALTKAHPDMKGIILDLRSNPGGRVDQAAGIVNLFVQKGEKVLEIRLRDTSLSKTYRTMGEPWNEKIPLAILMNPYSASASEIVAGAIQDLDRGIIVGSKSFGKGLVQSTRPLSFNTQLKITIARYYTPSGRCIQAIDYAAKRRGADGKLLQSGSDNVFQTRNGRTVYSNGGIDPDWVINTLDSLPLIKAIKDKGLIFSYANQFVRSRPSIDSPDKFVVTDAIYKEFLSYLSQNGFEYQTASEQELDSLTRLSGDRGAISSDLQAIKSLLLKQKQKETARYEKEIKRLLLAEIIQRYYFDEGLYLSSFVNDETVISALEILSDLPRYQKILSGK